MTATVIHLKHVIEHRRALAVADALDQLDALLRGVPEIDTTAVLTEIAAQIEILRKHKACPS